jgi:hypothetical protein
MIIDFLFSKSFVLSFIGVFILFYFILKIKSKKKLSKRNTPTQLKKNVEYVHQLINGHYETIPSDKKNILLESSKEWIIHNQEKFYNESNHGNQSRLRSMMKKDSKYDWPKEIDENTTKKQKVFLADIFTEPFPSSHDMPEFHLRDKFTEILVLSGIKSSESHRYGVRIKNHLVNHKMFRGIIRFDILLLN